MIATLLAVAPLASQAPGAVTVASLQNPSAGGKNIVATAVAAGSYETLAAGEVPTLSGAMLAIAVEKNGPRIGGSHLLKTDIETSNGVIHVVDAVILPK